MKRIRLRRHESFPLREGWIEKGIQSISTNGALTFSKDNGVKLLGIGANMVKSLKYWMIASNIIDESLKVNLTEFGEALLKNDPYMEKNISWWLLHYFLVSSFEQSPVLYYIYNKYNGNHIDKDNLKQEICEYFERKEYEYNPKLVNEDVNMYLRLYFNDNKSLNPEDNLSSPLAKLNLLDKNINNDGYIKKSANLDNLNYLVVYYALQNLYQDNFEITEAYIKEGSPCKIFNLDKGVFNQFIVQLKNAKLITVNKTAGLNSVYLNKHLTIQDIYNLCEEVDENVI